MTKDEQQFLLLVLRALERVHFQNLAFELLLERYRIPQWKELSETLAADQKVQPQVRERFRQIYADLEQDHELASSSALAEFLRALPVRGKPN